MPATPTPTPSLGGLSQDDYAKALEDALGGGGLSTTSGAKAVPVDTSGMVDTWNLPAYLKGDKVKLWFDTGHESQHSVSPNGQDLIAGKLTQPNSFDINATAEEVMKQFAAMSQSNPTEFAALQKQLADGNFYGSAAHIYGGWNAQTENALASAMRSYLQVSQGAGAGVSFVQYLQNTATSNQQINGNGGNGTSSTVKPGPSLTDPDQLKATAQSAAQQALGRNLSQAELDGFVNAFHANETSQYDNAKSGQAYTNPDPSAEAINYVVGNNQGEYNQHEAQGYVDSFLKMIGVSNAPDVTPAPQLGGA